MKCPACGKDDDKVLESRSIDDGSAVRRRRECIDCKARFTSYERVEEKPLVVIKKDNTRQPYSREKLVGGIRKSCEKRPVSSDDIEQIADDVEKFLYSEYGREVPTSQIGEIVMDKLQNIDQVAYVRFASVYRQFEKVTDFVKEIKSLN
ncbi:MAG: transcriptional regulator NrdR [Candidatus Saganbacteria bacterium]|nr:transcriptional regulator NrdR [Candidatus Saganbacteria bacterium]